MTVQDKLSALRKAMLENQIDAYIVPSTDPHQSEYPADRWASRKWLSGFTGSAGTLVVTLHEAKLWTDSRYFLQANTELAGTSIELMKDRLPETPSIEDWLGSTLLDGQTVGADGRVISAQTARRMEKKLSEHQLKLVKDDDLLRRIWADRPAVPSRPVFEHAPDFSGEPWQERLTRLTEWMTEHELDYYVVSALDEVAWLLNLRGSDIDHNPLCVAYFVAGRRGDHALFAAPRLEFSLWTEKTPDGHTLETHPYEQISSYLRRTNAINADIGLDPATISDRLCMHAGETKTTQLASPIPGWKAIKNETALGHLRETMAHDAVALLRLRRWLDGAIAEGINEHEVELKLSELRGQHSHYVTDSFTAIVGYGGNGAIVHYRAPEEGSAELKAEGILLLDSGGQYHTGTTDITRTFAIGPVTEEMRRNHTLVLQGHIDLGTARFPAGTTGVQLDAFARRPLWSEGLDYGHGTGHGVGFFLNVHEGPAGILQNPRAAKGQLALRSGMVLSNEPGYYKTGEYGIRVENLVVVREADAEGFLEFETITLFPIERALIVKEMLSPGQIAWVNEYHAMVLERVSPLLEGEELEWLTEACAEL
ncbi:aminopeptidase P family protein [Neolewinella agarilytica]|uniref:Xaa-Pro aminopeptidase n=1 Tax=Neolewinella agarilytica TaxID=478744 RepID=A0A1H9DQZ3_9BACT|nr:aminopeptidase P family protein [Neolewinella agarilytica]SEQ15940.1 Xaa-Pro aminopeptidase [Neolewinella agarilytica]